MVIYTCFRYEKTSKDSEERIFDVSKSIQMVPADSGHDLHQENQQKSQKSSKHAVFQKSIIFYVMAGNMIFGRKYVLWYPKTTQKP